VSDDDMPTEPPPPPDVEERVSVQIDKFDTRMDVLEDKFEKIGADSQAALKLLHGLAQGQARSESIEASRHANLDAQLDRIELHQKMLSTELARQGKEQGALHTDDESLRELLRELLETFTTQIGSLLRQLQEHAQRLDEHSQRLDALGEQKIS
jgi:hypothetical protein